MRCRRECKSAQRVQKTGGHLDSPELLRTLDPATSLPLHSQSNASQTGTRASCVCLRFQSVGGITLCEPRRRVQEPSRKIVLILAASPPKLQCGSGSWAGGPLSLQVTSGHTAVDVPQPHPLECWRSHVTLSSSVAQEALWPTPCLAATLLCWRLLPLLPGLRPFWPPPLPVRLERRLPPE